jgi:hypothetical protein
MDGCGPPGPLAPAGRVGSEDGLRVNMKSPNLQMNNAPSAFVAQMQLPRHNVSSSSSFRCLRQRRKDGEGDTQRSHCFTLSSPDLSLIGQLP